MLRLAGARRSLGLSEFAARLETLSRALSEAFHRASDEKRRCAALRACGIAVSQAGLNGEVVDAALSIIRDGGSHAATRLELQALSEHLDGEYLRLQDQDDSAVSPEVLLRSRRARAASALAFALSVDAEQLHEALYEAAFASEDQAGVVRSVESALL